MKRLKSEFHTQDGQFPLQVSHDQSPTCIARGMDAVKCGIKRVKTDCA
jgi:hypothetical protein